MIGYNDIKIKIILNQNNNLILSLTQWCHKSIFGYHVVFYSPGVLISTQKSFPFTTTLQSSCRTHKSLQQVKKLLQINFSCNFFIVPKLSKVKSGIHTFSRHYQNLCKNHAFHVEFTTDKRQHENKDFLILALMAKVNIYFRRFHR